MANTFLDLSDGDITRRALDLLHNKLVFCKNINRQYDSRFAQSGAKNGGDLLIRKPSQFTVTSGSVMNTQDITEESVTLTVATQRHVDLNLTDYELTMQVEDFEERILAPAMARLASEVDAVTINNCYKKIWNTSNTTFGTQPDYADIQAAQVKVNQGLAPDENRIIMLNSLQMANVVNDTKSLFSPADQVEKGFKKGLIGEMSGFELYRSEMVPTHTCGTRTDTTPVCNTSTGITSGSDTITITAAASGTTIVEGDVFTIEDVYAVNPETKVAYPHLQQFVAKALSTAVSTNRTVTVYPTPITSGARQNVSLVSAGASKSVSHLTASDGTGAASTAYANGLAWHRDAFTMVTADLVMPQGAHRAGREVYDGISLRVWADGDIVNDKFPMRIDVLFGSAALRPEWACRIIS